MKISKFEGTASPHQLKAVGSFRKNRLKPKDSGFSTVFASAVGGGTIGSVFGVPGLLVGVAVGSGIGLYVERKTHG